MYVELLKAAVKGILKTVFSLYFFLKLVIQAHVILVLFQCNIWRCCGRFVVSGTFCTFDIGMNHCFPFFLFFPLEKYRLQLSSVRGRVELVSGKRSAPALSGSNCDSGHKGQPHHTRPAWRVQEGELLSYIVYLIYKTHCILISFSFHFTALVLLWSL